jgi:hypothetical protein
MIKKIFTAAALCSAVSAFASGNLLIDGSFESAVLPTGTYQYYEGTSLYGWAASTGEGDAIEIRNNVVGTAQDGTYFAELDSRHNSSMSQSFSTVVGQTYSLSFWYSNRAQDDVMNSVFPGGVVPVDTQGLVFNVGAGNVAVPAIAAANTTTDNQWKLYTTTFVATGGTTTLSFAATGTSDSWGTSLDNVAVSAVPEPAPIALFGAGALLLAGLGRRRNRDQ